MLEDIKGSIRVYCRSRPLFDEEIAKGKLKTVQIKLKKP